MHSLMQAAGPPAFKLLYRATAAELARRGATVYLGCRNTDAGDAAAKAIRCGGR